MEKILSFFKRRWWSFMPLVVCVFGILWLTYPFDSSILQNIGVAMMFFGPSTVLLLFVRWEVIKVWSFVVTPIFVIGVVVISTLDDSSQWFSPTQQGLGSITLGISLSLPSSGQSSIPSYFAIATRKTCRISGSKKYMETIISFFKRRWWSFTPLLVCVGALGIAYLFQEPSSMETSMTDVLGVTAFVFLPAAFCMMFVNKRLFNVLSIFTILFFAASLIFLVLQDSSGYFISARLVAAFFLSLILSFLVVNWAIIRTYYLWRAGHRREETLPKMVFKFFGSTGLFLFVYYIFPHLPTYEHGITDVLNIDDTAIQITATLVCMLYLWSTWSAVHSLVRIVALSFRRDSDNSKN